MLFPPVSDDPWFFYICPQWLLQSAQNLHFGMSARSMDHNCLTSDPVCSNGHI